MAKKHFTSTTYPNLKAFGHSADGSFTGGKFESPLYLDATAPASALASAALSRALLLHDIANFIATSENASEFEPHEAIQLVMPLIEDVKALTEAVQQRIEAEAQAEGDHGE